MRWVLTTCLAFALGAPAAGFAADNPTPLVDPGELVPGHPGMDYLALAKIAIPDLALSPDDHRVEGHLSDPGPRHLAGHAFEEDLAGPMTLGAMQDKRILVGGHRRIALLANIEGAALLILYDDEGPAPTVLDIASVGLDKDTVFTDQPPLKLGPGDEALVSYSEHDDADLTMGHYLMISALGDHLQMIDRFDVNSVTLCSWSGAESAKFATRPDPGRRYRRIDLAVTYAVTRIPDGCADKRPRSHKQIFRASYRWDGAQRRFITASDALKRLNALNEKGS
jgi:hypothetical protein